MLVLYMQINYLQTLILPHVINIPVLPEEGVNILLSLTPVRWEKLVFDVTMPMSEEGEGEKEKENRSKKRRKKAKKHRIYF